MSVFVGGRKLSPEHGVVKVILTEVTEHRGNSPDFEHRHRELAFEQKAACTSGERT